MALINATAIPSSGGYEIDQSLRFNDNDNATLTRTPTSAGNRKTWTFSVWFKLGNLTGATERILNMGNGNAGLYITSTGQIGCIDISDSNFVLNSDRLLRDPSAWYHVVIAFDSTQSTASNRIKGYLNGELVAFTNESGYDSYPSLNQDGRVNTANEHIIGGYRATSQNWDGYLGEVNFIDGAAKAPADFGETGDYGEWKPIEYEGTYGTNGFYLPFKADYTVEGFSTVTYAGTSVAGTYIGGVGFQSDLTWVKNRGSSGENHSLYDAVRGGGKTLYPNLTAAENSSNLLTFTTDGFTQNTTNNISSGNNYVAWNWDMGGSNASNTDGSITSTVRANATYGQSIVKWTGNGTTGHGLSSAPEMIIVKPIDVTGAWWTWHKDLSNTSQGYLQLNTTAAEATNSSVWDNASPVTSSTINVNTAYLNYATDNYIAYCFHSVTGYSKFGSYTGNASTNAVTTGFAPAFVMLKDTTGSGHSWEMHDSVRGADFGLLANEADAENTSGTDVIDFTDTGFTLKNSNGNLNGSGNTYIYMAFADKREYAYWLDQSGNNNDWTSNNLTESDISVDSPTNNFCTLNPLNHGDFGTSTLGTLSEGNLKMHYNEAGTALCLGTLAPTSGKWYCEWAYIHGDAASDRCAVGIGDPDSVDVTAYGNDKKTFMATTVGSGLNRVWLTDNVESDNNFPARPSGTIIQFAWDMDAGKFWMATNNQWSNSSGGNIPISDVVAGNNPTVADSGCVGMTPLTRIAAGGSLTNTHFLNCGQDSSFSGIKTAQGNQDGNDIGDFYYTPPTGFLALCTSNLSAPAVIPSEHFNTVLYTGNSGTNAVTGVGFQPDFTWFKARSDTRSHSLVDSLRGFNGTSARVLQTGSSGTNVEWESAYINSLDSDGFTLSGSELYINNSSHNYVAWNWKLNGSGSSNTDGSINTTKTSANVDAGFSISTYTGTGSAATVGHGLSKAPEMIIVKNRVNARNWRTYHKYSGASDPETDYLNLDETGAVADYISWNDTAPTSSVFSITSSSDRAVNYNGDTYIAYCWHSVDGYSKVGSYTGNGNADGTFVYTGFHVKWLLIKRTDTSGNGWVMLDNQRSEYNPVDDVIYAHLSNAEVTNHSTIDVDYVSNGFKTRGANTSINASGSTYIYIAFAETPFKNSNAR